MNSYVLLGVFCAVAHSAAQQFGPVPPRPQFLGATLAQGPPVPRQNFRPRQGAPRTAPEGIQQVQIQAVPVVDPRLTVRRPQPLGRVRAQFPQAQVLEQQRNNLVEDGPIQYKNKLVAPTPPAPAQFPVQHQTPKLLTPRPVIEQEESSEEDEDKATTLTNPSTTAFPQPARYTPSLQAGPGPVALRPQFAQPAAFRPQSPPPQPIGFPESGTLQGRQLIRPQRPIQQGQQQIISRPPPQPIKQSEESEEEEDEQPFFRQPQLRQQKKPEPPRQQIPDHEQVRQPNRPQQVTRQQPIKHQQQQEYNRPAVQREPHVKASNAQREKKPTVQTIRKFHEENEDGSITWGYENDDGSFKEETIGVDCVTRGKYGYYDPDGVKREYTYTTGIPCDKEQQEAEEAASVNEGFIDYTNNKYVFPNGDEIDLEAMVKNRARKPISQYRN